MTRVSWKILSLCLQLIVIEKTPIHAVCIGICYLCSMVGCDARARNSIFFFIRIAVSYNWRNACTQTRCVSHCAQQQGKWNMDGIHICVHTSDVCMPKKDNALIKTMLICRPHFPHVENPSKFYSRILSVEIEQPVPNHLHLVFQRSTFHHSTSVKIGDSKKVHALLPLIFTWHLM